MVKFVERDLASGFGHETSLGLGQTFTADCRDKVGGRKGNVRQIMVASNEMGGTETWNIDLFPPQILISIGSFPPFKVLWLRVKGPFNALGKKKEKMCRRDIFVNQTVVIIKQTNR